MAGSTRQRSQIYVTCRPIFSGQNAQVRKTKKIKELIKGKGSLRPLLRDIGETRLVEILRDLLESRTFESEFCAKKEFPHLFRLSPLRDAHPTQGIGS
jgi:hypothetical protein